GRTDPRRWMRWLGVAALAGVCAQGLLGIFRIELNALMGKTLALVHGLFAQLVFALLVSVAVLTSRSWLAFRARETAREAETQTTGGLRAWSILTACLVFGQLILGGLVRHKDYFLSARAHLLLAFVVVAGCCGWRSWPAN